MAKAAERHGGEAAPDVLGEKTILRARKSISATDWGLAPRTSDLKDEGGGDSMSGIRLSGRMMVYRCVMKSLRSMLRASPENWVRN